MKTRWIYIISTGLFALAMSASGIIELMRSPEMVAGFQQLGYPLYLMTILGVAKLLGAAALVYPRWRSLTEWAYAGFTFDLLGASASHAFSGDPAAKVIAPLVFLGLMGVSYVFFRKQGIAQAEQRQLSHVHA
ncbi:MAG: DoxX family protein [Candidatus Sericytochromatia bacterium]